MKRTGLVLLAIIFTMFAQAQVRIGILGGVHSSSIKESNNLPGWDSLSKNYKSRIGFHFGFTADMQIGVTKFYFQPAVIYYNKGRKYSAVKDTFIFTPDTAFTTRYTDNREQYINYVDIPLNVVYKYAVNKKTKLIIGAGPYVSLFYNGREKKQTVTINVDNSFTSEENKDLPVGKKRGQYKTLDLGVNALGGIEFGRVFLTVNFSHGLKDFFTSKEYDGSFRQQVIGGTLGIYLGNPVAENKKIHDKDKDGVPDDADACPDEPGTINGCPDKDADGIADKNDQCVNIPGLAKYKGCPIPDTDKDGINDELDKCPTVVGLAKYNGCPIPDTDNDGINDEEDKCPAVAGVLRYNGCPVPDTDGDGINDEEDKCPTVAGTKENNGCPQVKDEIVEKLNFAARSIQFEKAKATLLPASDKVLDEVVEVLKQNTELKLSIEGHTSNDGSREANMKLSEQRAENVKQYLISKGIDASRLESQGFGPDKPIGDNRTKEGKVMNRRVELKASNQ